MNVLMMALAKIATRCPEVLTRVILCLTKIIKSHAGSTMIDTARCGVGEMNCLFLAVGSYLSTSLCSRSVVLERAVLLLNTLKQPAVAAAVLSAPTAGAARRSSICAGPSITPLPTPPCQRKPSAAQP